MLPHVEVSLHTRDEIFISVFIFSAVAWENKFDLQTSEFDFQKGEHDLQKG